MSEIFDIARKQAAQAMMYEKEDQALAEPVIETTLPDEQMKEVVFRMFEEIQTSLSGLIDGFKDYEEENWGVEINVDEDEGCLEIVFREENGDEFSFTYIIGQHDEFKKDGIIPGNLSFTLEENVKFNVNIESSASERSFWGIGSYEGVIAVSRRIATEYLKQHFIDIARGLALLEVQQED